MFSNDVGERIRREDKEYLHVRVGERGHVVSGPYEHVRPGVFRVEYHLALAGPGSAPGESVCATLDVTAHRGEAVLARQAIHVSELGSELRCFSLEFELREFRALEYRVHSEGLVELLVGSPIVTRLGDVEGPPPPADPSQPTSDPVELNRQVRAVLRLLRPYAVKGFRKVRLGNAGDGGYVCIDDFEGLDTALSLGINDDISWDREAADRGMTIFQFDHTVDDPAPDDSRMIFSKTMIASETGPGCSSLSELIRAHDKGRQRPNMMLKMDIEGHEWSALETTSTEEIARFSQIVCELHYFEGLSDLSYRRRIYSGLQKLASAYAVAHVHGNACAGWSNLGNVVFPNVLEVTFVNRSIYEIEETDELFPGDLDISCDAHSPDMFLGSFRF